MHVFLPRRHRHTNRVFRLVYPVYAMNTYIIKVNAYTKHAESE